MLSVITRNGLLSFQRYLQSIKFKRLLENVYRCNSFVCMCCTKTTQLIGELDFMSDIKEI